LFEPTASLLTIPESVIIDLVDDSDDDMKRRYLSLLAKDARTSVRERVAVAALALSKRQPADAEELLRSLSGDVSVRVRAAAGKSLAAMLESAPPFERLAIVGRWKRNPASVAVTGVTMPGARHNHRNATNHQATATVIRITTKFGTLPRR
jgi:hypothetical protein